MIKINGKELNVTKFPDRTSQVWRLDESLFSNNDVLKVEWEFQGEDEFMHLAQLKSLLDVNGCAADLIIKYLPYGRQDKETANDASFALRPFAHLLNSLAFTKVFIIDPHSSIATDLIKNSKAVYPLAELFQVIDEVKPSVLCYPDKGAVSKYAEMHGYKSFRYIYGEKVRDQLTGRITSYEVMTPNYANLEKILIVDDICDGGATFELLTQTLKKRGAQEINLFVTHGIFSKGLKKLKEVGINRIFTAKGEYFPTRDGEVKYKPYEGELK